MDKYGHEAGNDAATILDAGLVLGDVHYPVQEDDTGVGTPFIVIPQGAKIAGLSDLLRHPTRIFHHLLLHDPESFIQYVKDFKEYGTIIIYNRDEGSFKAILDFHESHSPEDKLPRWCDHTARFTVRRTDEWDAWVTASKRKMSQTDFAHFLEEHSDDLADGQGPTLLKIALNLEIKNAVSFTNSQRLEDGSVRLSYEEDVKGTAMNGAITIPPTFRLAIQPFLGGPMYNVECRFRYKLENRAVMFWYEIIQYEKLIEIAMNKIRLGIEEATGIKTLAGE